MSDTPKKSDEHVAVTAQSNTTTPKVETEEQEALWARSLKFFETMNDTQQPKHAKI